MAGSFYQAYVEILPDFSKFDSAVKKGVTSATASAAGNSGEKLGSELGDDASKGFRSNFVLGGAVAGVVGSITSSITSSISQLASEAITASDATNKFKQTLNFAGVDDKAIAKLSTSTRKYADSTVYDLETIQSTTAQLAANSVPNYDKLVEAAGNLNAVAGGNADTFKSVGMVMTQTAGAGKLTTENWNQLSDAIPGASGKIQEALLKNGAYTGNFREAMEKGQISSEEFNAALMQLGNEPVAVEAAKSTETFEGALGNLQATVVGGFSDALNTVKPVVTGFFTAISNGLQWLFDNQWALAGIGAVILTLLVPAIWAAVVAAWSFTAALLANPIVWIAIGIGLLIAAIVALWINWDVVVKWITEVWGGFMSWIGEVLNGFLGWWNGLWTAVWEWIVGIWNTIVTAVTDYFNNLWLGIKIIGQAISDWWNGLWNGVVDAFKTIFGAIGDFVTGIFEGVVNGIKGFINMIIDLVNGAIDGLNGMAGWLKDITGGAVNIKVSHIPKLADGGIVQKRRGGILANIGEGRYDEAVIPLSPSNLAALEGTSSSDGQTINIYSQADDTKAAGLDFARRMRFGLGVANV